MAFDLLSCNYEFEHPKLQKNVKSYQVITYGKYRVGVTGVGETTKMDGIKVVDPVVALNNIAKYLKEVEACDLVVCLSHLGFDLKAKENNHNLAASSTNVDLVIGGNIKIGRSLLRVIKNAEKEEILLGQNYSAAQSVSQVSFVYDNTKQKTSVDLKQRVPGASQAVHVSESLSLIKTKNSKYNT
jgi:5'-nucleotidase